MQKAASFVIALALVFVSTGCGPAETPAPGPNPNPPTNPNPNPNPPTNPDPGVSDPGTPDPGTPSNPSDPADPADPGDPGDPPTPPPPPPSNCPVLSGTYRGTLGGKLTGFPAGDVEGTIYFKVDAETAPGTYKVSGEQESWIKTMALFKTKQPFTGEIKCGKLGGSGSTTIFGVKTSGSVNGSCAADGSGCNGNWSGKADDNSSQGSGTFTVTRQ